MAFSIKINEVQYDLDIDLPTDTFDHTLVGLNVSVSRTPILAGELVRDERETFSAQVRLEYDDENDEQVIVVDINGEEFSLPVDEAFGTDSLINQIPGH